MLILKFTKHLLFISNIVVKKTREERKLKNGFLILTHGCGWSWRVRLWDYGRTKIWHLCLFSFRSNMAFSITRRNKTWIVGIYLQENEYFSTILRIYPGILTYHWNSMNGKMVHWTNLVYKAHSYIYIQYKVVFFFFKKNYFMMINNFRKVI